MANMCTVEAKIVCASLENLKEFCKNLCYKRERDGGKSLLFYGCSGCLYDEISKEGEMYVTLFTGECKWSVSTAMISLPNDVFSKNIVEETNRLGITMELFSAEPGCQFQEHYIIDKGDITEQETVPYKYIPLDEFTTKEDAETELDMEVTDEDWSLGYIEEGGFNWDYSI